MGNALVGSLPLIQEEKRALLFNRLLFRRPPFHLGFLKPT